MRIEKACAICGEIKPIHLRGMCRLCYGRERYRLNRERIDELRKKRWPVYYQKNKEHMKVSSEKYRLSPKGKAHKREYDRKRRNIKRFGGMATIVYERADNRCELCGESGNLHIHHKDGHSYYNGTPNNQLDNLLLVCVPCHHRIHSNRPPCAKSTREKIVHQKIIRDKEYQKTIVPRLAELAMADGQKRTCALCGLISTKASVIDLICRVPGGFDPVYRVPKQRQRQDAMTLDNGKHWLCRNSAKCRRRLKEREAVDTLTGHWHMDVNQKESVSV